MKEQFFISLFLPISFIPHLKAQDKQIYLPKGSLNLRTNVFSWGMSAPDVVQKRGWSHWRLNSNDRYWCLWNSEKSNSYN